MLKFNSNSPKCSFEIILFILKLEAKRRNYKRLETITINHLKIVIAQFYIDTIDKQYTEGIKDRFAKLLKYYGMESIADEYRIKFISNDDDNFIETLPFFESYHLTRLDIWILATYYKIPIIVLYYPNKALIETKDEFSLLTTYFEEGSSEKASEEIELSQVKEKEDIDIDLPFMGESARPITSEKLPNVQGYYFIISPAIKSNVVPSYSIIFRKEKVSETSGITSTISGNEYYMSLNILTHGFQSIVIQQQSTQYINHDEPAHSEDDESAQMKESIRYKNSIMQFIQNFKPPSKKGKGDDSSSVGTGVSLDIQEELEDILSKKLKKSRKPRQTINMSSLMLKPSKALAVPQGEASEQEQEQGAVVETKPKRKPRVKGTGRGITINTSGLTLPERKEEQSMPVSVSLEPVKKPKSKKLTIDTSNLPLFGSKVLPPQQRPIIEEDTGLSDIPEASETSPL